MPASASHARRRAKARYTASGVRRISSPDSDAARAGAERRELERVRGIEREHDRLLVIQAQSGDLCAFRRLVERHEKRAFAIALAQIQDREDAREIVQEAFIRVYRGLHRFSGGSSFFTWFYRIVCNLCVDYKRKPARRETELDECVELSLVVPPPFMARVCGSDPMDHMRRTELAKRLQAALDALPPYHRGVILMREVEGMSYDQMAEAMEVSKGTIMSRLFHARQKLQCALADYYCEHRGGAQ